MSAFRQPEVVSERGGLFSGVFLLLKALDYQHLEEYCFIRMSYVGTSGNSFIQQFHTKGVRRMSMVQNVVARIEEISKDHPDLRMKLDSARRSIGPGAVEKFLIYAEQGEESAQQILERFQQSKVSKSDPNAFAIFILDATGENRRVRIPRRPALVH